MSSPVARCGARTRSGGTCRRIAMPNGRCDMHGGKSLRGIAHPQFRTGQRSRYALSGALEERYTRHLADLDYIALRDEIALATVAIEDLAAKEERTEGEETKLWGLVDLRRRLADTEAKRVKLAQETLTGEQIRAFAAAVLEAVRRHVPERERLAPIQTETLSILQTVGAVGAAYDERI